MRNGRYFACRWLAATLSPQNARPLSGCGALLERHHKTQQPPNRKPSEMTAQHFRCFRLLETEQIRGLGLFHAPPFQDAVDPEHQLRLNEALLSVGHAYVFENVPAPDFASDCRPGSGLSPGR